MFSLEYIFKQNIILYLLHILYLLYYVNGFPALIGAVHISAILILSAISSD